MNATPLTQLLPTFTAGQESAAELFTAHQARQDAAAAGDREAQIVARENAARAAGYTEGLNAGGAVAADALDTLNATLTRLQENARDAAATQVRADTATILECAATLAEWVIAREVTLDPTLFVPAVEDVISDLSTGTTVTVAVHPDVHGIYEQWAQQHREHDVTLTSDPRTPYGEAVVTTHDGGTARVGAKDALRRALAAATTTTGASAT